jgi:hypothetical protein
MKRLILAALVAALAIALAAPVASAQYPKPPRWTQAEDMYWNNNVASKGGSTRSYSSPAVMI